MPVNAAGSRTEPPVSVPSPATAMLPRWPQLCHPNCRPQSTIGCVGCVRRLRPMVTQQNWRDYRLICQKPTRACLPCPAPLHPHLLAAGPLVHLYAVQSCAMLEFPAVLARPATWMLSFTIIGTPCSGPRNLSYVLSASRSAAILRAPSRSKVIKQARAAFASAAASESATRVSMLIRLHIFVLE